MNKIEGGRRFSGYNKSNRKMDPYPGTIEFYKLHMPERFNNTMINIKSAGFTHADAERFAANVLRWHEQPLSHMKIEKPPKCPACGFNMEHTDKPFPKWDDRQPKTKA